MALSSLRCRPRPRRISLLTGLPSHMHVRTCPQAMELAEPYLEQAKVYYEQVG